MIWSGDPEPVTVSLFSVTGTFLTRISADSWEQWVWDGRIDGEEAASGVYMAIIESGSETILAKVAVVR